MGIAIDSGGKGKRRTLDAEVNLVPMIDFLVVTIAFLVLTAAWTAAGRVEASAALGGHGEPCEDCRPRKLVLDARGEQAFLLTWKEGEKVIRTVEVPKRAIEPTAGRARQIRYPELAKALSDEWSTYGQHRDRADKHVDPLVLRTSNELPYAAMVGLMDATSSVRRPGPGAGTTPGASDRAAFELTLAVD
ncbi:MAG: biopolymer transporter ExbD [Myxococcales bacterium]|jgi:biopolymer transport protein ExbD|nr:biopolymer transporter ExbD [Myxococcales bacterium]MBL0198340.1 biopolymer transporter ExbD [Myxococcales bacterium]HQY61907.1 biopolymer transporter ExbD [Polyangiaceae bacterium]